MTHFRKTVLYMTGCNKRNCSQAFTLIELLVVVGIITVFALLLLPRLSRAKQSALAAACRNNLRQIGFALSVYAGTFNVYPLTALCTNSEAFISQRYFDGTKTWREAILPDIDNSSPFPPNLFTCPMVARHNGMQLVLNDCGTDLLQSVAAGWPLNSPFFGLGLGHLGDANNNIPVPESLVLAPADMIAVVHGYGYTSRDYPPLGFGWPGVPLRWHQGGELALFCDTHVESAKSQSFPQRTLSGIRVFKPDASSARRWNRDNKPHPETWQTFPAN